MKDFKYQITVAALSYKRKQHKDVGYTLVSFNNATKTVINFDKYNFDKSFQETLYRIDNWINEGSGWIIESVNGEYVNVSVYSPLIGSTYIELPNGLKKPMKSLIKIHPERLTKVDKK